MPLTSSPSEPALADPTPGLPPIPPISSAPLPPLPPLQPPPIIPSSGGGATAPMPKANLVPARFSRRIWAGLIDWIFVSAAIEFLTPSHHLLAQFFIENGPRATPFWCAVYFAAMWTWRGTTLGGIIMQLQVVRLDGQALKPEVAIIRAVASLLSMMPLGLGFIWAAWDAKGQTWHDKIAGTMVVAPTAPQSLI